MSRKAVLCLTPGDPLGIGPEITVKWLTTQLSHYPELSFRIIGSLEALKTAASRLGRSLPHCDQVVYEPIEHELPGLVSYQAVEQAVMHIAQGDASAMVTGPIAKHHLQEAGVLAHGHTEILELLARQLFPDATKAKAEMLFLYHQFRLLLLTRHIPLSRVSSELQSGSLRTPLDTLIRFLRDDLGIERPRLAMLGVNPHAGEVGGVEETLVLEPTLAQLNAEALARVEGPFPADAFFRGFQADEPGYDAIIAAYHDQGLIPFKLLAGYQAVNVTIGLPFIRTSVGHGTAFDIAGQGISSEESLIAAVDVAAQLVRTRQFQSGLTAQL